MTALLASVVACGAPACMRDSVSKGFCRSHYERWRKHRNVLYERPTPEMRFLSKIQSAPAPNGCMLWQGSTVMDGYGVIGIDGVNVRVHRYAWERVNGKISDGMVVDHTCRIRHCVNVDHMRIVTRRVNNLENSEGQSAKMARLVWCVKGLHELGGDNRTEANKRRGSRECKACANTHRREKRRAETI